jgi:hypothetical protein
VLSRKIALGAAAAAVALGASLGATAAQAGVSSHVFYTTKSVKGAVSGYFASAQDTYFTHITSYIGSDGPTWGKLAVGTSNGAGDGLCDQNTGEAVQEGIVNNGDGTMNVGYDAGTFTVASSDGDKCHAGTIAGNGASSIGGFQPLIKNVPIGNTVVVDILSDQHHAHNGCVAGQIVLQAEDLSGAPGMWHRSPCFAAPGGVHTVFNEADTGTVADDTLVAPLSGAVPQPDGAGPSELGAFAHVTLSGNDVHGVVHGSFQNNANWTAFPVASTNNGAAPPAGSLLLAPTIFFSDHYRVNIGGAVA